MMIRGFSRYLLVGLSLFLLPFPSDAKRKRSRFVHRTPTSVSALKPVVLKGRITKGDDLDYAELRYRKMGTLRYFSVRLKAQSDGSYKAVIPAKRVRAPGIEYYVVGVDFNQKPRLLFSSPAMPGRFLVIGGAEEIPGERRPPPRREDGQDGMVDGPRPQGPARKRRGEKLYDGREVTSASRGKQDLLQSPMIVTIVTAKEIRDRGWRTLLEILREVVGIDINNNGYWPEIGMRGINQPGSYGQRILFLIDGHNMSWRQFGYNLLNPSWIAVDDIKRIEVVRGAGAAIWGSGALHGMVHIITKSGKEMQGYSATLGVGALSGTHFLTLRGGDQLTKDISFYATFSLHNDFRSPILSPIYEFFESKSALSYVTPHDRSLARNFYARFRWKGLSLTFHNSHYDPTAVINPYSAFAGNESRLTTDRFYVRLGWTGKFGTWGRLKVWASFDRYTFSPQAAYEMNPLSPFASTDADSGKSRTYYLTEPTKDPQGNDVLKFHGYYPNCRDVENENIRCIKIVPQIEYSDQGKKRKLNNACVLVNNWKAAVNPKVSKADRYKTWFPPSDCTSHYDNGRYLRSMRAEDNRIEAGLRLTIKILDGLFLLWGLDGEFLNSVRWHFPATWAKLGEEESAPVLNNFRIGTYLQAEYHIKKFLSALAGIRLDYDQRYQIRLSPQAGLTGRLPVGGKMDIFGGQLNLFGKLLYANGFRGPSLYDFYYHQKNELYGNPELIPEGVHTISLQLGGASPSFFFGLTAYLSFYDSLIAYLSHKAGDKLALEEEFPNASRPDSNRSYKQKGNSEPSSSMGGEVELRWSPLKGLSLKGFFGLAWATYTDPEGNAARFFYSAGLSAGASLSYRYQFFLVSLGFYMVPKKLLPNQGFSTSPRHRIPAAHLLEEDKEQPVPTWTAKNDLSLETPSYFMLHLTIQFLKLFGHLDLAIRASNIAGLFSEAYDAGSPFLYPQQKFELLTWMRFHF